MPKGGFEPLPRPFDDSNTSGAETVQIPTNTSQINALTDSTPAHHEQELTLPKHEKYTSLHAECATCVQQNVPDELREVMDAWGGLPEAVRVGIVAMVRASREE